MDILNAVDLKSHCRCDKLPSHLCNQQRDRGDTFGVWIAVEVFHGVGSILSLNRQTQGITFALSLPVTHRFVSQFPFIYNR